jgi:hypothetical protein
MTTGEGDSHTSAFFPDRRSFLKRSAAFTALFSPAFGALLLPETGLASDSNLNILGPRPGYPPQVGVFVSMLTWMREANGVISATEGLTMADLDYLIDPKANTIGALMLHLAATETYRAGRGCKADDSRLSKARTFSSERPRADDCVLGRLVHSLQARAR